MRKFLIGFVLGGVVATVVAAAASKAGGQGPTPSAWEKMKTAMEGMPEDFPPRVMYDNVETAKANTEEILDLLRLHAAEESAADPIRGS